MTGPQIADPTIAGDRLLDAFCDVRGITPKVVPREERNRLKSELANRFHVDRNGQEAT